MDVLSLAESAIIVQEKDTLSKVSSEMRRKGRHEALVFDGKTLKGIVTARDIVKKTVSDPSKATVGGLRLARPITPFSPDTPLEEMIAFILMNDFRAAPILSGNAYYIVTKLALLKSVGKEIKGLSAADMMFYPQTISPSDPFSVALSLLKESHPSRLAVVEKGKLCGVIDTLDLLQSTYKSRSRIGGREGEKPSISVTASSVMLPVPIVSPSTPLKEVIKIMLQKNAWTIGVEEGTFAGIITPAGILKLHSKETGGIYVRISGQEGKDPFITSVVHDQIRQELGKLAKLIPISSLIVNIKVYNEEGKRKKYSLHSRLITQKGFFFAEDYAWDLTQAVRGVLKKLEKEILKKAGKRRLYHLRDKVGGMEKDEV